MMNIINCNKKTVEEHFKELLNKMLEENQYFGTFQDFDLPNNRVVKGTIRIELEISDLEHLI